MKVLFVVDTLGAGGAERSLQELLPSFVAEGIEVLLACFHRRADGVEHLIRGKYDVRMLQARSRLAQMAALRRIVRDEGVDLVHTTLFEADVYGRSALLGLNVPIVTSLVNMPYEPARLANDPNVNRRKLMAVRGLEIATGLLAHHFHAITEAVREAAVQRLWIPRHKITVVHRGRDPVRLGTRSEERRRQLRERLGIPDDTFVVLNAARREFQKGQRFLLEAFEQIGATNKLLLIAGREGNASQALNAIAERPRLAPVTRFLGHRDDVPDVMAAADVFVLPSLWEGLGCVLLEAMALELPIVASDLPPIREIVEHESSALLVPPSDPNGLAQAIDRLSTSPGLSRHLTANARRRFESNFTLDKSARAMLALFEDVTRRSGRTQRARTLG